MNRKLLVFPLVLTSVLSARLPAQTPSQATTASAVHFTYGEKTRIAGITDFGKINDHLYRGAQPRSRGLLALKKLGVTTIVDLRAEDPAKSIWEEKRSESLGIHFVQIPVGGWAPPTDQQVAQFLSIFRSNPQEKVFVHCHFGEDRTGVFIATYRMAYESITPTQALKEMHYFGFHGFWHPSMAAFVHNFPERLATAPLLVHFKNAN